VLSLFSFSGFGLEGAPPAGHSPVLSDLAMVTLVVHLTGGIDSSLNFLYPLVIVVGVCFARGWGYLSAALAFILFGTVLELDYYLVITSFRTRIPS